MWEFRGAYSTLMFKWLDGAQNCELMWLYKEFDATWKSCPLSEYSKDFEMF